MYITDLIGLALAGLRLYVAGYGWSEGGIRTGVGRVMGWAS